MQHDLLLNMDKGHVTPCISAFRPKLLDLRSWMSEDKLKLNEGKTELLLVGTKQQLAEVCVEIAPSSVRNLGVWFDSCLNMITK